MDLRKLLRSEDNYIKILTSLNAGVDDDKIASAIITAQDTQMIRVLGGEELFYKLLDNLHSNTLSGIYLEMYDKYIAKMCAYYSAAEFIELYQNEEFNSGILISTPANTQVPSEKKVERKAKKYRDLAVNIEIQFQKFIAKNPVPEFKVDDPSQGNSYKFNWFLK
jgi:hypothetical protein